MKRTTKILLILTVLMGLGFFATIGGLIYLVARAGAPTIADGSVLVLDLTAGVADQAPDTDLFVPGLSQRPPSLYALRQGLKAAKTDRRIRGATLYLSNISLGWAVAEELRQAIFDFRESGKQAVAIIESGADMDYFVATAADRIYLVPEGSLFLNGLALEAQFYHDTLAKLGIEAEFHHIGEYKSAPDSFLRMTMSDAQREVLNSLADGLYGRLLEAIVKGRKLSLEGVTALIDDFRPSGPGLVESGLIDGLRYPDQVYEDLGEGGKAPELVWAGDYLKAIRKPSVGGPHLAVLYVSGEIRSGESGGEGIFGGGGVGSETIVAALRQIEEDEEVKGLLVRVNSPGGSATAADLMWRGIMRFKEKTGKPVVISMSDLAASGGYWIATAGDAVVAQPSTLTGSIGVFFGKFNVPELLKKVGANIEIVSRGRHAEMFSPTRRFNDEEVVRINGWLRETYDTFLSRVAQGRGMALADVEKCAGGRVWTGAQALENGLVDELGGMDQALVLLKARAQLGADQDLPLETYPRGENFLERLTKQLNVHATLDIPAPLSLVLQLLEPGTHGRPQLESGAQVLIPFVPRLH